MRAQKPTATTHRHLSKSSELLTTISSHSTFAAMTEFKHVADIFALQMPKSCAIFSRCAHEYSSCYCNITTQNAVTNFAQFAAISEHGLYFSCRQNIVH